MGGIGWQAIKLGATLSLPTTRSLGALWNCCDANRAFVALCTSNPKRNSLKHLTGVIALWHQLKQCILKGKSQKKIPCICCFLDPSNMGGIHWPLYHTAPFRAMLRFKLTQLCGNLFNEIVAWESVRTRIDTAVIQAYCWWKKSGEHHLGCINHCK